MEKQILKRFIKRWLFPAPHEQPIDFYSGRMLAYTLMDSMGFDAERLYKVEPDSHRTKFENADAVVNYLTEQ